MLERIKNKKLRILVDILFIIGGLVLMYFFWMKK
jgi:hypothetical protein